MCLVGRWTLLNQPSCKSANWFVSKTSSYLSLNRIVRKLWMNFREIFGSCRPRDNELLSRFHMRTVHHGRLLLLEARRASSTFARWRQQTWTVLMLTICLNLACCSTLLTALLLKSVCRLLDSSLTNQSSLLRRWQGRRFTVWRPSSYYLPPRRLCDARHLSVCLLATLYEN